MTKRLVVVVAVLAITSAAGVWWRRSHRDTDTHLAVAPIPAATSQKYQCSMHPQIVSDEPGTCPICQMKLTPVEEVREDAPGAGGSVPGHAPFTLSTARQQLIGVTRAPATVRPLVVDIRAAGRIAYDPLLYQAMVEYREALRAKSQIRDSPWFEAHEGADAIVRAAGLKLRQQGLSEAQIAGIGRRGQDPLNLLLPGRSVWVYAQVYEYQVDLVKPGQAIAITVPSLPGRTFNAEIASIDPILNTTTRTARVRALVATPQADLRPESFVNVTIRVPLGDRLAIPEDAVLETGEHQIVFVVQGVGSFEPRSVRLGRDAEGFYEVLEGLEPGEEVVTAANFLIDSESRFRAALAAFRPAASHDHPH